MYTSSVHSKIKITEKGGEIEDMDINVDGYRGEDVISYMDQELGMREPIEFYYGNWRMPLWKKMFYDMMQRMKRWKYRRL